MHAESEPVERRRRTGLQLLWLWVLLVVLYFSWEVATYRGLFAMIAEWQFERLGQDLPTFDFSLLTLAFSWPALLIVRLRFRAPAHDADTARDEPATVEAQERALTASIVAAAQEYMHFLFGFATALAIAAAVAIGWTFFLPTLDRQPVPLTPYAAAAGTVREGPTVFEGRLTYGRIASFGRGILFLRHTVLYAPVKPPAGGDPRIRYFVEFLPAERADIRSGGAISHRAGILVRGDMPGALVRLYRYLGYRIAPRYHVLYASETTLLWPYYMLAVQFAVAAIAFALVALWQRLHARRLAVDIAEHRRNLIARRERTRRDALALAGAPVALSSGEPSRTRRRRRPQQG